MSTIISYRIIFSGRSAGKLCLVLDLDHTLLNSIMFSELDSTLGQRLEERAESEMALPEEKRMLFRLDNIQVLLLKKK